MHLLLILFLGMAEAEAQDGAIPLAAALDRLEARWRGEIISAELVPGRPHERAGVVYEFRLLTPEGSLVRIRLDATDGAFLEAEGKGLVAARRLP
jgi:uncharacterized membrane protein YkoI